MSIISFDQIRANLFGAFTLVAIILVDYDWILHILHLNVLKYNVASSSRPSLH